MWNEAKRACSTVRYPRNSYTTLILYASNKQIWKCADGESSVELEVTSM